MLNISGKFIWTFQPKLSPLSYNLLGQSGFCHGVLALQPFFSPWITTETLRVSDRILSTLGPGAPRGQRWAFGILSGVSNL